MQINVLLTESPERPQNREKTAREDDDHDLGESDDDETTTALKTSLGQTSPGSSPHHHIIHILNTRLRAKEKLKRQEEMRYESYQQRLLSRDVSKENVMLLPHDDTEPLSTPIRNDLAAFE